MTHGNGLEIVEIWELPGVIETMCSFLMDPILREDFLCESAQNTYLFLIVRQISKRCKVITNRWLYVFLSPKITSAKNLCSVVTYRQTPSCDENCVDMCYKLKKVESLTLCSKFSMDTFNWMQLKNLTYLNIAYPRYSAFKKLLALPCLQANLTTVHFYWEKPFVMDFKQMLPFANVHTLHFQTRRGKYSNLTALSETCFFAKNSVIAKSMSHFRINNSSASNA